MSPLERLEDLLRLALADALAELDPASLVERALSAPPAGGRIRIVAMGKAAARMACGAIARWGDGIDDALVVTPADAAHPVPDARSVEAARAAMRTAGELGPGDSLLALVSGGASSLVALPAPGVSIDDKAAYVARLLESGAPISTVNLVRRHVSAIKGGRLAGAANGARVHTLILSDVIGGAPHDVGSGPTVPDPTTADDARRELRARGLPFPPSDAWWTPGAALVHTSACILAGPDDLARVLAHHLAKRGVLATTLPGEQGDLDAILARRLEQARALAPGRAIALACEPSLRLPAIRGSGGRAGRLTLAALRDLPDDVVLMCAASDGIDGSSGHAGAIVSARHRALATDADIDAALDAFDDARLHQRLGTALPGAPTGHNLTDVHVLARVRA